jgi:hypothetical protein
MSELATEIYQLLFISSITFILYVLGDLSIKVYGRFKLNKNTKFQLTSFEKVVLWLSIGVFFSYLL